VRPGCGRRDRVWFRRLSGLMQRLRQAGVVCEVERTDGANDAHETYRDNHPRANHLPIFFLLYNSIAQRNASSSGGGDANPGFSGQEQSCATPRHWLDNLHPLGRTLTKV